MATAGLRILTVGKRLALPYEENFVEDPSRITEVIAQFQPDVIVSSDTQPQALNLAPFSVRKRWIHISKEAALDEIICAIEACYAFNIWNAHPGDNTNPLISVYTGTWNTGKFLDEAYSSLYEQTYPNWEWVVVDDHSTDGTWERLEAIAAKDGRVKPFRSGAHLGKIGAVKDLATRMARGVYLVELDHDDMLTDFALDEIRKAFETDLEIGMVYSNCASFFEDGSPQRFNDDFWKDRYRSTWYRGKPWLEARNPDIYDRFGPHHTQQFGWFLTVGPNHVRAFRASTLRALGGYNAQLPVADDWDLYARMFLKSKCYHVDKMLYLYRYRNQYANTTFTRNKSIQDHLALGRAYYAAEFEETNKRRLQDNGKIDLGPVEGRDISFVIPAGSRTPLTAECLRSIREHVPGSEVILVANGSSPEDEAVQLADKVLHLETNLRFAAAVNRGAMEASRRILCVINDDARFVDAETPLLLARALCGDIGITGPFSNRAKPPQGDIPREAVPKNDIATPMVTGVCVMIPTELYRTLCGFDTRLYTWEDDDLCARARDLGYRSRVIGGTWVEHERHATFKARGENVYAVMSENRRIFQAKRPRIRIVAIAKDEETSVRGFFGQFHPLTTDWCLLDTGSSDRTKELARSMGVRVEEAPFEDFASARNEALKRFSPGADWVIMLDPDERLDAHTITHLRETLFRTKYDILLAPLWALNADGSGREFVPKPFCFRAGSGLRWVFKVHEKLIGSSNQALVSNSRVEHIVALHDQKRRVNAESLYRKLAGKEPYFTDVSFREKIRAEWPILDYDRPDDPRIKKIEIGPLVSVVIPTHRRPALLKKAVQSAFVQDYANLEIIVVGDACPDLDPASFASEPRIRVLNLPVNHGAGGAVPRNYGIMLAAGGLIAYLDDDNEWTTDHVSSLYAEMRKTNAAFVFSSMAVEGADLGFTSPSKGAIDTSCVLHRKDLVRLHGWWRDREEAGYAHDWEFFSRWITAKEIWSCTRRPTLLYNAATSGQEAFLKQLAEQTKA